MAGVPIRDRADSVESWTDEISDQGTEYLENVFQTENDGVPNGPQSTPPLEHEWVFWYDVKVAQGMSTSDYQNTIKVLGKFATIGQFWRYWNNLDDVTKYPDGTNLRLFKSRIKPMWEDPSNQGGGKWTITPSTKEQASEIWSKVALATIGEQFKYSDDLCGLVLSVRSKSTTIQIWNKKAERESIEDTSDHLKEIAGSQQVSYKLHQGALQFNQSLVDKRKLHRSGSIEYIDGNQSKHKKSSSVNLTSTPKEHRRNNSIDNNNNNKAGSSNQLKRTVSHDYQTHKKSNSYSDSFKQNNLSASPRAERANRSGSSRSSPQLPPHNNQNERPNSSNGKIDVREVPRSPEVRKRTSAAGNEETTEAETKSAIKLAKTKRPKALYGIGLLFFLLAFMFYLLSLTQ
eukprot:TRINITY_DN5992_c0_g1_i1.p1 TRINITY_DN5992_c0_g1~~TRINITY_DN5992_c0_g1_i1.p1  ORF type:complete len:402 (-),score=88.28 TRINITY_DN5992_c0_g1_i1:46-1251(-)